MDTTIAKIIAELLCGKLCFWCGVGLLDPIALKRYPPLRSNRLLLARIKTRDHFIPKSKGGKGFTVPCCRTCNALKGAMEPMEFRDAHRPKVPAETVQKLIFEAKFAQNKGVTQFWNQGGVPKVDKVAP